MIYTLVYSNYMKNQRKLYFIMDLKSEPKQHRELVYEIDKMSKDWSLSNSTNNIDRNRMFSSSRLVIKIKIYVNH
jgi:hypothetical protein